MTEQLQWKRPAPPGERTVIISGFYSVICCLLTEVNCRKHTEETFEERDYPDEILLLKDILDTEYDEIFSPTEVAVRR